MKYKIISETGSEPVTPDIAITHLKIDEEQISIQEYAMLENFIVGTRQWIEETYDRALMTKTVQAVCDDWPDQAFVVPLAPLRSVVSIKYYDEDDTEYTFDSTNYQVDTFSEPGRIILKRSLSWPSTTLRIANGIVIDYEVGYTELDDNIVKAILVLVDHFWQLRERNNSAGPAGQVGISDMLTRVNTWELAKLLPPDWTVGL